MGLLRFLLAISVLITHSSPIFGISLVGGSIAVQAFYMISGFYMALILNEKYIGQNDSYKLFFSNRLLRLFPIYWTVLAIVIISACLNYISSDGASFGQLSQYLKYYDDMNLLAFIFLVFTNLVVYFQDMVMFMGLDTETGKLFFTSNFWATDPILSTFLAIPQAWTISIELTFYLIAPFIARKKILFILPLIVISLLLRYYLYQNGLSLDPWSYRFFPTEMVFFLAGIISYRFYFRIKAMTFKTKFLKAILYLFFAFTLFYEFIAFEGISILYFICLFLSLPFIFILSKSWKRDRYIGELSYPIYICHYFIFVILYNNDFSFFGEKGITLATLSILMSIALNELVAKRVEIIRQKRVKST